MVWWARLAERTFSRSPRSTPASSSVRETERQSDMSGWGEAQARPSL